MGLDATIYFRTTDGQMPMLERDLPPGFAIEAVDDPENAPPGATHICNNNERYYGDGYERGSWPRLGAALMLLHACETVERVWYGPNNYEDTRECPAERVLAICAHFMAFGERPYRRG